MLGLTNQEKIRLIHERLRNNIKNKNWQQALQDCADLESHWEYPPRVHEYYGDIYFGQNNFKLAREHYRKTDRIKDESMIAELAYGDCEMALNLAEYLIRQNSLNQIAKLGRDVVTMRLGNAINLKLLNDFNNDCFPDKQPTSHFLEATLELIEYKTAEQYIVLAASYLKKNEKQKLQATMIAFFQSYLPLAVPENLYEDFGKILACQYIDISALDRNDITKLFKQQLQLIVSKLDFKTELNLRLQAQFDGLYGKLLNFARWGHLGWKPSIHKGEYAKNIDKLLKTIFCLDDFNDHNYDCVNKWYDRYTNTSLNHLLVLMHNYSELKVKFPDNEKLKLFGRKKFIGNTADEMLQELELLRFQLEQNLHVNPQTIKFIRGNPMDKVAKQQIEKYIADEKYDDALVIVQAALKKNKLDFDAHYFLARIKYNQKAIIEANTALEDAIATAITTEQKIKTLSLKCEWALEAKEYNKAKAIIKDLSLYSKQKAELLQAELYYDTNQFKAAYELYVKHNSFCFKAIKCCIQYGDIEKAQKLQEKYMNNENIAQGLYLLTYISLRTGNYHAAYDYARRYNLLAHIDNKTDAALAVGTTAFYIDNMQVAAETLAPLKNVAAKFMEAKVYQKQDQMNEAEECYSSVLTQMFPDSAQLVYARLQLMKLRYLQPDELFKEAVAKLSKVTHKDFAHLLILILAYLKLSQFANAQVYLKELFTNFLPMGVPSYLRQDFIELLFDDRLNVNSIPKESNIISKDFKRAVLKFVGTLDLKQQVNLRIFGIARCSLFNEILAYQRKEGRPSIFWGKLGDNIASLSKLEFRLKDINTVDNIFPYFNTSSFHERACLIDSFRQQCVSNPHSKILEEFGNKIVTASNAVALLNELKSLVPAIINEPKPTTNPVKEDIKKVEATATVEKPVEKEAPGPEVQAPTVQTQQSESFYEISISYIVDYVKTMQKNGKNLEECLQYINNKNSTDLRINALIQVLSPTTELGKFFNIKDFPDLLSLINLNDLKDVILDEISESILKEPHVKDLLPQLAPALFNQFKVSTKTEIKTPSVATQGMFAIDVPPAAPVVVTTSEQQITDETLAERYIRFALINAKPVPQHEPASDNKDLMKLHAGPN